MQHIDGVRVRQAIRSNISHTRKGVMQRPGKSTESLPTFDLALRLADFFACSNELVVHSLMISLIVIVFQILADGVAKRPLTKEDHP